MPLVFVTGISGAGKSTVRAELRRRGYVAYDTDEDQLSRYFEKSSGREVPYPTAVAQRGDCWFSSHVQPVVCSQESSAAMSNAAVPVRRLVKRREERP